MSRNTTLDNAKGVAILAVVIGHVLRGFNAAGWIADSLPLKLTDAVLYGFHVQTFFLIAGFLTFPKAASARFQYERQINLYYPYLFWSVVSWAIAFALSDSVNRPVAARDLILIPVMPIQHFWFLLELMIATAVLALLRSTGMLLIAAAVLVVLWYVPVLNWFSLKYNLLFVLAGAMLRAGPGLPRPHVGLAIAAFAVLVGWAWLTTVQSLSISPLLLFPIQLGGCYACYVAADLMGRKEMLDAVFSYLGKHSLAIYLLHVFGGSGARIILGAALPGTDPILGTAIGLSCAILLPLAFEQIAVRLQFARLLGLRPLVALERREIIPVAAT